MINKNNKYNINNIKISNQQAEKIFIFVWIKKIIALFFKKDIQQQIILFAIYQMRIYFLPIVLWGFATGIAMGDVLPMYLAIIMALLAYAGSAQLVVLPLIIIDAPITLMIFAACVVNIRFIIFSATLFEYLKHLKFYQRFLLAYINGDFIHLSMTKIFPNAGVSCVQKLRQVYFFTAAAFFNYLVWQTANVLGIIFAHAIPKNWGLAFIGTLALVPIVLPILFEKLSYLLIGSVAILAALYFHDLPYRLPLLIALLIGVILHMLQNRFKYFKF